MTREGAPAVSSGSSRLVSRKGPRWLTAMVDRTVDGEPAFPGHRSCVVDQDVETIAMDDAIGGEGADGAE